MSKRRFGRVRRLPSGSWQARYQGPDGIDRPAPETFATKTDAEVWLTAAQHHEAAQSAHTRLPTPPASEAAGGVRRTAGPCRVGPR